MVDAPPRPEPDVSPDLLPALADPAVPAAHLLGPGAEEVVAAALAAVGATVESTTPTGTAYHVGRSLTVEHRVRVRWADGRRSTEAMVLSAGRRAPAGALVLGDGDHEVVVWRVPADPWLPGLAPVLDPATVGGLMEDLGLPGRDLRCHLRAYRPGRRAVVEVTGPGVRTFLKVVRPSRAEALHRRHQALAGAAPVPASLGWSPDHGVVALQGLGGRTVRHVLQTTGATPTAGALVSLLDALPDAGPDAGTSWRAEEFAGHVGAVVPELADRAGALAGALAPYEAEAVAQPPVPVHGDLYEAQLLVDGGRIVGLLDVDTYGTGRRVDDLACYVGHLVVLGLADPTCRARSDAHARRVLGGLDAVTDPALLRAAVAGVVLGLATGPFRVLEPRWADRTAERLAVAEQWLQSADDVRHGS